MKTSKLFAAAVVLIFSMTLATYAGDMQTPTKSAPPPPAPNSLTIPYIEDGQDSKYDSTTLMIDLLLTTLSVY
jgi:hypothetical protein